MKKKKSYDIRKVDLELLNAAKKGDQKALEDLYTRYQKYGIKLANDIFDAHHYTKVVVDEFVPEIDFVFLTAFRSFSHRKGSFYAFFAAILQNRVKHFMTTMALTKDLLSYCVSLDKNVHDVQLHEIIPDEKDVSPKQYCYIKDLQLSFCSTSSQISDKNKELIKKILVLKEFGFSNIEIAEQLHLSRGQVSRLFMAYCKRLPMH